MPEPVRSGYTESVTDLLCAWTAGDESALDRLAPILHDELKRMARRYIVRERSGHTLQPTALVNELFLKLITIRGVQWQDRAHFFALCAQIMRRILVNYAVDRSAGKRGGCAQKLPLGEITVVSAERDAQLLELDEALDRLAKLDRRKARLVELRFFGGLSVEETAAVLKVSKQTVLRDWSLAKSWLAREMSIGAK